MPSVFLTIIISDIAHRSQFASLMPQEYLDQ